MKIFSSELAHNYGSYTFGYAHYCLAEPGDLLADIYACGYLPYTGSPQAKDVLYMARSARVVLKEFVLTSENRRIAKKFDGQFVKTIIPFSTFAIDEAFIAFCLQYFKARHGEQAMSRERFKFILKSKFITDVITYSQSGKPVAYVLVMREKNIEHYWFSFYDLSLAQQSLGMWLMLDCVREAKAAGLEYYYLGTVYGEKALYKTNFEPLQWWDGSLWSADLEQLKERGRQDGGRVIEQMDAFKQNKKLF